MGSEKVFPAGILGKKLGMTHVFSPEGECVPVTVIQAGPCFVLDVKSVEKHGYSAVQLGFEQKKAQRVDRAQTGHFAKAGKGAFSHVGEIRCDVEKLGWNTVGQEIRVSEVFTDGEFVDVVGISKGRGFAGVVKRFRVGAQTASRGTHGFFRHIGAIGCRKHPGRVWKNQKMPGHMGTDTTTMQNLRVVGVLPDENLILVRGGVPGAKGSLVVLKKAMKKLGRVQKAA